MEISAIFQHQAYSMDWVSSFALSSDTRKGVLHSCRLRNSHNDTTVSITNHAISSQPSSQIKRTRTRTRNRKPEAPAANEDTSKCKMDADSIVVFKRKRPSKKQPSSDAQKAVSVQGKNTDQRNTTFIQVHTIPNAVSVQGTLPALLSAEFFQCNALELAPKLLGKMLHRDDVILQITEVEAYCPNDSACHGRFGITPRTAPVFGPGGHAYVYLCYGMHIMLNIVADSEGVGAAVLIRACAPVAGLETIQNRRGITTTKPVLLTGPGKVGQALGLTTEWSSHPLYEPGGLEVLDGPTPENLLVGPRVGIEYAKPEHVTALWRFAIDGSQWISAPKNTLIPLQNNG